MLLSLLMTSPILFLLVGGAIVIAITIHEWAHAWVADRLGDPTPRALGRVTLKPTAHLDPIGTLALLIAGIGWGKPVPFDPYNLEHPQRDTMLIAFAGPASNLLLAGGLSLLLNLISVPNPFAQALALILQINVSLAIFNLVPVAPLDGSKIVLGLLPADKAVEWEQFNARYSSILLIFLILPIFNGGSLVSQLISPIINSIVRVLL